MADFQAAAKAAYRHAKECHQAGEIPTMLGPHGLMALVHETVRTFFKNQLTAEEAAFKVAAIAITLIAIDVPDTEDLESEMEDDISEEDILAIADSAADARFDDEPPGDEEDEDVDPRWTPVDGGKNAERRDRDRE